LGLVNEGKRVTECGKSHSCERPTSWSSKPSAQTISVALGSSETIRCTATVLPGRLAVGTPSGYARAGDAAKHHREGA
jgi:hypothetical protein